ncbi:PREDICTED: synaptotagmin-6-like [Acropora digitifera]|uniref:synaptotagmin-6-like n=1 Tax=Acropora digitifera TaxID=70779 RepID=UPI00077ADF42|nr:PREDICTED: synaptotagmin-6-like [Acropora digitifera]
MTKMFKILSDVLDDIRQKNFPDPTTVSFTNFSTPYEIATEKAVGLPKWVIILIAIGGGLLLGAATLVFVWRMRVKYKRELEKQRNQKYPRVSFTIPPPRKGESPIPLQTNYPQREQKGLENYLDPEIYREEEKEEGPPFMGAAKLSFSLRYDKISEELMVCLLRATRLTPIGENVTVTPYVKIFLLPDKKRKVQSRVQRRTSNPVFFEDFVFCVSPEDLPKRTLEFTVCEFDRFSRQQVIGHVQYPLNSCLFSLQFLPTSSRLTLAVIKAKDLKINGEAQGTETLDPYVKVAMIMGGKTVKKRKTVTKRRSSNPVYNEAFVFTLLPSDLDHISFMLSVYTGSKVGGSKKLIGRAVVGPYMFSTGQGLSHWNEMINSPRNPVAQWHSLI